MGISVTFIGHRKIKVTKKLTNELTMLICSLIKDGVTNFNFGSHSQFNDLCYNIVSNLKKQHPSIQRIHYCVAYENYTNAGINNLYEKEIDCESAIKAGKNSYLIRNQEMIDNSDICVFYYDENYRPPQHEKGLLPYQSKSGTATAFHYAKNKNKDIINIGKQNEFN